jgi:hypothetical protein
MRQTSGFDACKPAIRFLLLRRLGRPSLIYRHRSDGLVARLDLVKIRRFCLRNIRR